MACAGRNGNAKGLNAPAGGRTGEGGGSERGEDVAVPASVGPADGAEVVGFGPPVVVCLGGEGCRRERRINISYPFHTACAGRREILDWGGVGAMLTDIWLR